MRARVRPRTIFILNKRFRSQHSFCPFLLLPLFLRPVIFIKMQRGTGMKMLAVHSKTYLQKKKKKQNRKKNWKKKNEIVWYGKRTFYIIMQNKFLMRFVRDWFSIDRQFGLRRFGPHGPKAREQLNWWRRTDRWMDRGCSIHLCRRGPMENRRSLGRTIARGAKGLGKKRQHTWSE